MLKGFLSHYQYDSEILTKILEEKQGQMPPFEEPKSRKTEFQSPKAGKTLLFPSENNAFVEGKHTICRGKTYSLTWENQRFALLKQAFQPAQAF